MGLARPGTAAGRRRIARSLLRSGVAAALGAAVLVAAASAQTLAAQTPAAQTLATPGRPTQPPGTDLSIKLTNQNDAAAGKPITYEVVVHNNGPLTASLVQIDFTTTAALDPVTYNITNGHCYRSPKEIACLFWDPLRPGANASVSISGVMPRKIAQGTVVTNRVVLASATPLAHTADDKATDVYRMGVPRPVAPRPGTPRPGTPRSAAPRPVTSNGVVLPAPSAATVNPTSKLGKLTATATKWMGWATHAVTWVFIVLAAAFAWFAIGLWLHRRRRLARGDDDDLYYADAELAAEDTSGDDESGADGESGSAEDENEPDRVGS